MHTSFLRVLPPKVNYCRITGNRKDVRWLFAKIEQFCTFMNLLCFTTMALYTKLSEPLNERVISDIINVCVLKIIAWFIITFSVILVWAGITIKWIWSFCKYISWRNMYRITPLCVNLSPVGFWLFCILASKECRSTGNVVIINTLNRCPDVLWRTE